MLMRPTKTGASSKCFLDNPILSYPGNKHGEIEGTQGEKLFHLARKTVVATKNFHRQYTHPIH